MTRIKYYIIHNLDPARKMKMDNLIQNYNIPEEDVCWVLRPNKDEITPEIREQYVQKGTTFSCGVPISYLKDGYVCVTFKHYLALQDIVKNKHPYAVIMEDDTGGFVESIPERLNKYLSQLPEDWDILFDNNWCEYIEGETIPEQYVYKKNNAITPQCHGGTKLASFYFLTLKCAEKLYEHYVPFNNAPDWWMNDLFRKLDIQSYWAEPPNVLQNPNHTSST